MPLSDKEIERLENFLVISKEVTVGLRSLLLPLTGRKASDFGGSPVGGPVKDLLINKEGTEVYIAPKKYNRSFLDFEFYPEFKYSVDLGGTTYYVFKIQKPFLPDVQLLLQGRYTEISEEAKKVMRERSGLQYNKKIGPFYTSSGVLQALEAVSPLKTVLAEYLEIPVKDMPKELLKPVPEDSYLFIENFIEVEG